MNFNRLLLLIFVIFFSAQSYAQDVIMATSEDLKEFDQMLSKKSPLLQAPANPNTQVPGNSDNDPKNKKHKKNFRDDFNHLQNMDHPGQPPGSGPRPPMNGNGSGGQNPPPPPPPRQ